MELFVFAAFLLAASIALLWIAPRTNKGFERVIVYAVATVFFSFHVIIIYVALGSAIVDQAQPECDWLLDNEFADNSQQNSTNTTYSYVNSCEGQESGLLNFAYGFFGWFLLLMIVLLFSAIAYRAIGGF